MTLRVLVIGKSGQLATALDQMASAAGLDVVTIGRETADLLAPDGAEGAIAAFNPAVIVNAAAYTAVDRAESEPRLAYAMNATGARHLARTARRYGIAFIQVSTDYVFDGAKQGLWLEDDPVGPLNIYGASKLAGELLVAAAHEDAVIVRTSWLFSATGSNFVRTMLRVARDRPTLDIVDDQFGRPTSAASLARAILVAIPQIADGKGLGGVYHLANDGPVTNWHEFATAIFATTRDGARRPALRPIPSSEYPTAARRPANSALAIGKFIAAFGYRPPPWREALDDVLRQLMHAGEA